MTSDIAVPVDRPGPGAVSAIPAELFVPSSGHGPGLVLVQEIFGRTDYLRGRAQDLADAGYVVLVPQLYWRIGEDAVPESADQALQSAMALSQKVDLTEVAADVRACVAFLREHEATSDRVGLIGFCFGGGVAYLAASAAVGVERPDVLVSYYGSALPQLVDTVDVVTVPSLHHFGEADAFLDTDTVAHVVEVISGQPGTTVMSWPDAGHAFDNPAPAFHSEQASREAWSATLSWLGETLPVDS